MTLRSSDLLPIGMVAARSGVAASALRFYEDEGLIRSIRSPGGIRHYQRSTLRRIAFIRAAQTVGLSLEEIRDALATLPGERTPTREDWARLSRRFRDRIERRIAALVELRDNLTGCIGCGCLSLQRCRLYNWQDVLAGQGSGPRRMPEQLRERAVRDTDEPTMPRQRPEGPMSQGGRLS